MIARNWPFLVILGVVALACAVAGLVVMRNQAAAQRSCAPAVAVRDDSGHILCVEGWRP